LVEQKLQAPAPSDDIEDPNVSQVTVNYGDNFKVETKLEKIAGEGSYMLYIDSQQPIDFIQLQSKQNIDILQKDVKKADNFSVNIMQNPKDSCLLALVKMNEGDK
jgi:hypothetical protein